MFTKPAGIDAQENPMPPPGTPAAHDAWKWAVQHRCARYHGRAAVTASASGCHAAI
jgi:hypothetical protein